MVLDSCLGVGVLLKICTLTLFRTKSRKIPIPFRTTPSILGPCLEQLKKIHTFFTFETILQYFRDWAANVRFPVYDWLCISDNGDNRAAIPCLGRVHTLFGTNSHKIIYPVQDRQAKNLTLFSGKILDMLNILSG